MHRFRFEIRNTVLLWLGITVLSTSTLRAESLDSSSRLTIRLKTEVNVEKKLVTVADVAEVDNQDHPLWQEIRDLDVSELESGRPEKVTRAHFDFRLQLAGIDRSQYRLLGADHASVVFQAVVLNERIVFDRLVPMLAKSWNVDPKQIHLQLTRPLTERDIQTVSNLDAAALKPVASRRWVPGHLRIQIGVFDGSRLAHTFPVNVLASIERNAYVAVRDLPTNSRIADSDVRLVKTRLVGRDALSVATDVVDRSLSRRVSRGDPILLHEIRSVNDRVRRHNEYVVERRDRVRMYTRMGGLEAYINDAEALERGKIGEQIRVKNPRSGEIKTGRVTAAGEVTVR